MIETKVLAYLGQELNVPIYAEKPTRKTIEYVLIRTIDETRTNLIDACSIYIESISDTLYKASVLNDKVKKAMYNFPSVDGISACKLGGGGQNIDVETKTYQYESVFNIWYTE